MKKFYKLRENDQHNIKEAVRVRLTKKQKNEIADNIYNILSECEDEFIINNAENMTIEDEDGISDLDIEDMKGVIIDFIIDGIRYNTGWELETYEKQLNDLYNEWME